VKLDTIGASIDGGARRTAEVGDGPANFLSRQLPSSITTRPVKGEAPTLDLVIAYHKANKSPILKAILSSIARCDGRSS
jgi:hypothetical protein